jgi:hypothetical protein
MCHEITLKNMYLICGKCSCETCFLVVHLGGNALEGQVLYTVSCKTLSEIKEDLNKWQDTPCLWIESRYKDNS